MEPALKQRLIGAAVLVALAVIFLPMLVQGPAPESGVSDVPLELPNAPTGEYEADDPLVLNVGEVAVIEARRNRGGDICTFAISPNIYSKIVIDSVSSGTNAIWFRIVANPNCGFRSFAPGLPKN